MGKPPTGTADVQDYARMNEPQNAGVPSESSRANDDIILEDVQSRVEPLQRTTDKIQLKPQLDRPMSLMSLQSIYPRTHYTISWDETWCSRVEKYSADLADAEESEDELALQRGRKHTLRLDKIPSATTPSSPAVIFGSSGRIESIRVPHHRKCGSSPSQRLMTPCAPCRDSRERRSLKEQGRSAFNS